MSNYLNSKFLVKFSKNYELIRFLQENMKQNNNLSNLDKFILFLIQNSQNFFFIEKILYI